MTRGCSFYFGVISPILDSSISAFRTDFNTTLFSASSAERSITLCRGTTYGLLSPHCFFMGTDAHKIVDAGVDDGLIPLETACFI